MITFFIVFHYGKFKESITAAQILGARLKLIVNETVRDSFF